MIGRFIRFVLTLVIVVGALAYLGGYWQPEWLPPSPLQAKSARPVDTETAKERARDAGREIAQTADRVGKQLGEAISDGALTAKIKSKMTLDDTIDARSINVDTTDHIVTLTGTVASDQAHERAVQLAKETTGVKKVVDRLAVSK
jgi:hyperosmotically inducible periplasmic protein